MTSSVVDSPQPLERVYSKAVTISGWLFNRERDPTACTVRAKVDGTIIGETRWLFVRRDVCDLLAVAPGVPTGFRLLAQLPDDHKASRSVTIEVTAQWRADGEEEEVANVTVEMLPSSLDANPR